MLPFAGHLQSTLLAMFRDVIRWVPLLPAEPPSVLNLLLLPPTLC